MNQLATPLSAPLHFPVSGIARSVGASTGDRVLTSDLCCGVNALARLGRDVLERAGAKDVILLMGINDIGFSVTPPTR